MLFLTKVVAIYFEIDNFMMFGKLGFVIAKKLKFVKTIENEQREIQRNK